LLHEKSTRYDNTYCTREVSDTAKLVANAATKAAQAATEAADELEQLLEDMRPTAKGTEQNK
jgi:methyl-accepting chemotaxis protein